VSVSITRVGAPSNVTNMTFLQRNSEPNILPCSIPGLQVSFVACVALGTCSDLNEIAQVHEGHDLPVAIA
jgi:hypothetical protein